MAGLGRRGSETRARVFFRACLFRTLVVFGLKRPIAWQGWVGGGFRNVAIGRCGTSRIT